MGLWEVEDLTVLAPFRPSTTLENLLASRVAVVNLTDDVRVFAGCVTGRRDWPTLPARHVAGRVLQGALAHRELELVRVEEDPLRPCCYLRELWQQTHAPFRGFNRAQAAVLEAAILVSRLDRLPPEKIEREIDYLRIAVDKTAGPAEREAWEWLMERVTAASRPGPASG
jgi:hypothetical protein